MRLAGLVRPSYSTDARVDPSGNGGGSGGVDTSWPPATDVSPCKHKMLSAYNKGCSTVRADTPSKEDVAQDTRSRARTQIVSIW